MKILWLSSLLCIPLLISMAAYAIPPTTPLPPQDPLLKALERGDSSVVHQIENKSGAGPGTRVMDHAQLSFNIPLLLSTALRCQSELLKRDTVDDIATALYCSYLARSSALIEGDALAYLHEAEWVKNTLFPTIDRTANDHAVFGTGLDYANLLQLARTTPAVTETWLAGSKYLTLQTSRSKLDYRNLPAIEVQINGHKLAAFVGSDSAALRTPITIIESSDEKPTLSAKLKLTPLVQDYVNAFVKYGGAKYQITPSLYLADEVMVGPLLLHHVAVGVATIDSVPPGVYLSQSLWRQFGEVAISDRGIRLSRQPSHQCAPVVPMTFAANYYEFGSLQFPITLNGTARVATLSIGATDPVYIDSAAWTGTGIDATDPGAREARVVKEPIVIQVGHQSFSLPSAYVETNWSEPFQVSLGRPIFDKYTVQLQLRGGTPSICLAPNDGEARNHAR